MSPAPRALQYRLLTLATGILVAACGPKITSDRDKSIPIPAGATVEFEGGVLEGTNQLDPSVSNNIVHRRIQLAIVAQLTQRGFTMVDSTKDATFRVRYYVGVTSSTSLVTTTTGMGEFLTELRPAVSLFLRFTGIDYDGDPFGRGGAKPPRVHLPDGFSRPTVMVGAFGALVAGQSGLKTAYL